MRQSPADTSPVPSLPNLRAAETPSALLRALLWLAAPIVVENFLLILVGVTDVYLANHLIRTGQLSGDALAAAHLINADAGAAVNSAAYIGWFLGLLVGAVGTGATAIIARAIGGRHRREANACAGQALALALTAGLVVGAFFVLGAGWIAPLFGLNETATGFVQTYVRITGFGTPLACVLFTANACLRGAGDTTTPAITMVGVNILNVIFSVGLCYGMGPFPGMGFAGIALGTVLAQSAGGLVQLLVLRRGRGGLRLIARRLLPRVVMTRRILRLGLPNAAEGVVHWGANFVVLIMINSLGSVAAAAHGVTLRLEAFSYMTGYAVATAAATMVGQSLGMQDPQRARRCGYLAYAVGGGTMVLFGLAFIFFSRPLAATLGEGPEVIDQAARTLFIAGFCQCGFAATLVFGGALRGAGDTVAVMRLNLSSVLTVRMVGVLVVMYLFDAGLVAVWLVLATELMVRGSLLAWRFISGRWEHARV